MDPESFDERSHGGASSDVEGEYCNPLDWSSNNEHDHTEISTEIEKVFGSVSSRPGSQPEVMSVSRLLGQTMSESRTHDTHADAGQNDSTIKSMIMGRPERMLGPDVDFSQYGIQQHVEADDPPSGMEVDEEYG